MQPSDSSAERSTSALSRRRALRRLAGVTAGAAFLPLLNACASGSTTGGPAAPKTEAKPTEPAKGPAAPTAAPAAQAPAAKAGDKVVYARTRDPSGTTDKLVQAFNGAGKGLQVELLVMPDTSAEYRNALVPQLQAKSGDIDVFTTDVIWTAEFATAGWALDLTQRFDQGMRRDFLDGPVSSVQFEGKFYGVPYWTDAGVFWYRKDILEDELKVRPPETWDDLVAVGQAVKERKPDVSPFVFQAAQHEAWSSTSSSSSGATAATCSTTRGRSS